MFRGIIEMFRLYSQVGIFLNGDSAYYPWQGIDGFNPLPGRMVPGNDLHCPPQFPLLSHRLLTPLPTGHFMVLGGKR